MKNSYEEICSTICGDGWKLSENDRNGAYGVAMCLAHLHGCRSDLLSLSKWIDEPVNTLQTSYHNLQLNGIFQKTNPILDEECLNPYNNNTSEEKEKGWKSWQWIAGLSSGYTGKGFTVNNGKH